MALLIDIGYILHIKQMYNDLFRRSLGMFTPPNSELDSGPLSKHCMCKTSPVFLKDVHKESIKMVCIFYIVIIKSITGKRGTS